MWLYKLGFTGCEILIWKIRIWPRADHGANFFWFVLFIYFVVSYSHICARAMMKYSLKKITVVPPSTFPSSALSLIVLEELQYISWTLVLGNIC